jgi:hypothetical protein
MAFSNGHQQSAAMDVESRPVNSTSRQQQQHHAAAATPPGYLGNTHAAAVVATSETGPLRKTRTSLLALRIVQVGVFAAI